ncbi:hypothetical protein RB599_011246, partial [Gaeumannomyces hyphopodioides]
QSVTAAQAAAQAQSQKSQTSAKTARGKGKNAASSAAASTAASEADEEEEEEEEEKAKPKPKAKAARGKAVKGKAASTAASAAASEAEEEEEEEEEEEAKPKPKTKAAKGKAAAKRAASTTASAAASDDEDKKPKPKPKGKAKAGAKRASTAAAASDDEPDAKPLVKRAKKGANGAAGGADADSVDDSKPAAPAKGKAAAKSAKVKKEDKTDKVPAADGQIARSKNLQVPLDEACMMSGYAVYIDDQGHIWDASLNQTNASNNNNKFYRVQIIRDGKGDFKTWTRWGRVGELGQKAVLGNGTEEDAINQFEKKFKDKSGHSWEDRLAPPKAGKYTFVERSYNEDSDDEDEVMADDDDEEGNDKWIPPTCSLEEPVQELMKLIFNQQYFAAAMSELNYDANKLPLGKLSKSTISRGFQALKDLSALLDDPSLAQADYGMNADAAIEHLSNSYYSVIPHAFGRGRPPVICEESLLKKEVELLESLSDMKDANNIMGKDKAAARDPVHPVTKLYNGLNLEEMTALENSSDEFKLIKDYLNDTRGATHGHNYTVKDIFRIERAGEHERFDKDSPLAGPPQDRRLLWHGSRVTNFGGILSQGLRIAPPEAPVSGYMFGKGIYLADMSSKSANYCCSYISGGEALLLLCEAELGSPMQELTNADYQAGEKAQKNGMYSTWGKGMTGPKDWRDAGAVHASLEGTTMPDTSVKPGPTKVEGAYLQYNEFIVYDVSQVRLRYLLRVKM